MLVYGHVNSIVLGKIGHTIVKDGVISGTVVITS